MSAFKDMIKADIHNVFLNTNEFAEFRTIKYDGKTFENIPVVFEGLKESTRRTTYLHNGTRDHGQGLYEVSSILRCAASDIGGLQPEKGQIIKISDNESDFFYEFYITSSLCEFGLISLELGAIDE